MKVESTTVKKIMISEVERLDPISVILEDLGPGKGKIIIECYSQAWSAYWAGMSDRTIAEFFCSCDDGYLAGNLSTINSTVTDFDGLADIARKYVLEQRRQRYMTDKEARKMFDLCGDLEGRESFDSVSAPMQQIYGDEWWHSVPDKANPDYEYLCRIINAVQAALKSQEGES